MDFLNQGFIYFQSLLFLILGKEFIRLGQDGADVIASAGAFQEFVADEKVSAGFHGLTRFLIKVTQVDVRVSMEGMLWVQMLE